MVVAEGRAGVDGGADGGGGDEAQPPAVLWCCCPHLPAQKEISLACPPLCGNAINHQQSILRDFIAHYEKAHDAAHLQMFVSCLGPLAD